MHIMNVLERIYPMVCIYCGNKTAVANSRAQSRQHAVWRRRSCKACKAVFTTIEQPDFTTSLMIEQIDGTLQPFERDVLFYQIAVSCGHRNNPVADAHQITATVLKNIISLKSAVVPEKTITELCAQTLQRFDTTAATYYIAYFSAK